MIKYNKEQKWDLKGAMIMSCSQAREGKTVHETTEIHTLDDFQKQCVCVCVMKYLQFSLQQPKQGESFCFNINDVCWGCFLSAHFNAAQMNT